MKNLALSILAVGFMWVVMKIMTSDADWTDYPSRIQTIIEAIVAVLSTLALIAAIIAIVI